jgi:hypothetical protein
MTRFVHTKDAMTQDPREEKLPAWTRNTLAALRRAVSEAESRLADHKAKLEPTQVFWEQISIDHNPVFIPERADVVFDFGGNQNHQDLIRLRWRGPLVEVMAGSRLDIQPQASNTINLALRRG